MSEEFHAHPVPQHKKHGSRKCQWYKHAIICVIFHKVQDLFQKKRRRKKKEKRKEEKKEKRKEKLNWKMIGKLKKIIQDLVAREGHELADHHGVHADHEEGKGGHKKQVSIKRRQIIQEA